MQQHIGKVMSPWLKAIQLAIQHVGNCRERMPVSRMDVSEGPLNACKGKTTRDLRIYVNIFLVIVIDESVAKGPSKNNPDDYYEEKTNNTGGNWFISSWNLSSGGVFRNHSYFC